MEKVKEQKQTTQQKKYYMKLLGLIQIIAYLSSRFDLCIQSI